LHVQKFSDNLFDVRGQGLVERVGNDALWIRRRRRHGDLVANLFGHDAGRLGRGNFLHVLRFLNLGLFRRQASVRDQRSEGRVNGQ